MRPAAEERVALEDANGRLLAALARVGARLNLAPRMVALEHRLAEPGVADGRDPVGLLFAVVEGLAAMAEVIDQELAEAAAAAEPTRAR